MLPVKKRFFIAIFFLIIFFPQPSWGWFWNKRKLSFENIEKTITLMENNTIYSTRTKASTIEEMLTEKSLALEPNDQIIPESDSPVFPGLRVEIRRAFKINIAVDGKEIEIATRAKNISQVIAENDIILSKLDRISPSLKSPVFQNQKIIITRINEEEKTIQEEIDFKTTTKTDSKLGWREEKIEQKGKPGLIEINYKITYKNGKEISRIVLEKNVLEDPTTEIITKGTKVKFGDIHTGLGTWYAQPSGIQKAYPSLTGYYVANPWLPKGSYVKITNKANGKSVIAVVNDRGPFGDNRIVDLDKKAFAAIASLGAGVIDVKVEEILN